MVIKKSAESSFRGNFQWYGENPSMVYLVLSRKRNYGKSPFSFDLVANYKNCTHQEFSAEKHFKRRFLGL